MNDEQLRKSWRIGLLAMGLIPVLQLCFLAYYSHFLYENGIRPIEVMSRPPMSVLVLHPAIAIGVGVCLAVWVLALAFRKSGDIGHVAICQVVLALMALHLTRVVLHTSELATSLLMIHLQNEQHSQNKP